MDPSRLRAATALGISLAVAGPALAHAATASPIYAIPPASAVALSVAPAHAHAVPYAFRAGGRVTPPAGATAGACTSGLVKVTFKLRPRVYLGARTVPLASDCTFRTSRIALALRRRRHPVAITVVAHFFGGAAMGAADSPAVTVHAGG